MNDDLITRCKNLLDKKGNEPSSMPTEYEYFNKRGKYDIDDYDLEMDNTNISFIFKCNNELIECKVNEQRLYFSLI